MAKGPVTIPRTQQMILDAVRQQVGQIQCQFGARNSVPSCPGESGHQSQHLSGSLSHPVDESTVGLVCPQMSKCNSFAKCTFVKQGLRVRFSPLAPSRASRVLEQSRASGSCDARSAAHDGDSPEAFGWGALTPYAHEPRPEAQPRAAGRDNGAQPWAHRTSAPTEAVTPA